MRHIAAVKAGLKDRFGAEQGGWNLHIEGALGELAMAKHLGLFWSASVNTFHAPDLGAFIQVRTRSSHAYDLIVRMEDDKTDVFALLTGVAPEYWAHGWILGVDAQNEAWWKTHGDRPGAWFVPKQQLRPFRDLNAQIMVKREAAERKAFG
jgi:hypothetical protein